MTTDDDMRPYCCSYPFGRNGSQWAVTVYATSFEDAAERLKAIGGWGTVDGELMATIPAYPGVGLWVRASTFFRNLIRKRRSA